MTMRNISQSVDRQDDPSVALCGLLVKRNYFKKSPAKRKSTITLDKD